MDAEELIRQAADSVRAALDDAQRRAQEIIGEAEAQAQRIRAEAEEAASGIRDEAETQAQRRLEEVRRALDELRGRLSDQEGRGVADAPEAEVEPGPVTVPEPEPPATPEPMPEPVPEPMPEPVPEPTPAPSPPPGEPDRVSSVGANGAEAHDETRSAAGADTAARLVAMKLALDGTPRADARERLAADYDVADLDGLLDEVYAKARE